MTDLLDLVDVEPWKADALCAQTDPEAFYPEKGGSTMQAKLVCRRCPVRQECLDSAIANDERFGIWGGYSERERRRIRRGEQVQPKLSNKTNLNQNGHGYRCTCPACVELRAARR